VEPELPPEIDQVLARGLAKEPEARWATAEDFSDALGLALSGRGRHGPPPPRVEPAPAVPSGKAARPWIAAAAVAVLLLAAAIAAVAIDNDGGGEPERAQSPPAKRSEPDRPREKSTPERRKEKPKATATASPTATASASPTATATATPERPSGSNPTRLNARGWDLFLAGNYAQAIPWFEQAVSACGDSTEMDPCGYTLYNLGAALRRSGDAKAAIPILEQRMERFGDNAKDEVRKELDEAYKDAGIKKDSRGENRGKGGGNGRGGNRGRGGDDDDG
jgi:tetratricopeptide (TPR) repeat protein